MRQKCAQEDIEADRSLLKQARNMKKGDKMSRDQYNALWRKVGGTKGGFFGESVEVKGKYIERGYVQVRRVRSIHSEGLFAQEIASITVLRLREPF